MSENELVKQVQLEVKLTRSFFHPRYEWMVVFHHLAQNTDLKVNMQMDYFKKKKKKLQNNQVLLWDCESETGLIGESPRETQLLHAEKLHL